MGKEEPSSLNYPEKKKICEKKENVQWATETSLKLARKNANGSVCIEQPSSINFQKSKFVKRRRMLLVCHFLVVSCSSSCTLSTLCQQLFICKSSSLPTTNSSSVWPTHHSRRLCIWVPPQNAIELKCYWTHTNWLLSSCAWVLSLFACTLSCAHFSSIILHFCLFNLCLVSSVVCCWDFQGTQT